MSTDSDPVEIVGHSGLDDTERVIVDAETLRGRSGDDVLFLARYLTTGNDVGAVGLDHRYGGWTIVRDAVTLETLAKFADGERVS